MSIVFDSTRPVNVNKSFGAGLARPSTRRNGPLDGKSDADIRYAAEALNADARDFETIGFADAVIEDAAGCALASARMDAGYSIL